MFPILPLAAACFALSVGGSGTEIRPSFDLNEAAWFATDIVVVTEGEVINGHVTVLDVWLGDCRVGQRLNVEELAVFADEKLRREFRWAPPEEKTNLMSGQRMILFLRRNGEWWDGTAMRARPGARMAVSTIWVENNKPFGLVQVVNPGDAVMTALPFANEAAVLARTREILAARSQFRVAEGSKDPASRAEQVGALLNALPWDGKLEAFDVLAATGTEGLPPILALLTSPEHQELKSDLVSVLGRAGGKRALPTLIELAEQETRFFGSKAASLKRGWWNGTGLDATTVSAYRGRYSVLYRTLKTLETIPDERSRAVVTALRTLWVAHPALNDPSGLDQITKQCDMILQKLD